MIKAIIFDWVGTLYERDTGLFPLSKKMLIELKQKYKLGLVTIAGNREGNTIKKRREELATSGVILLFDSIIIDKEKTIQHYIRCMQEMGTIPETTAIVDDRSIRGIQIGNKLGCTTYWIKRGEYAHEIPNEKTGEPTHTIDSIEELKKFLL